MRTWSCRLRRSQGRQPQRGCVPQPGVAPRHEGLPRESTPARRPNPEGVASLGRAGAIAPAPPAQARRNPVGVGWNPGPLSPGSGGYAATRGYGMEPRWGSQGVTRSGNPTRARARWPRKRREEMGESFALLNRSPYAGSLAMGSPAEALRRRGEKAESQETGHRRQQRALRFSIVPHMPGPWRWVLPQRRGGAEVERSLAAPPPSGRCAAVCGFAASLVREALRAAPMRSS